MRRASANEDDEVRRPKKEPRPKGVNTGASLPMNEYALQAKRYACHDTPQSQARIADCGDKLKRGH